MPNTILVPDQVAIESLMHFENELVAAKIFSNQWEEKFGRDGAKIGDTCRLRKPVNFTVREGQKFTAQNIEESSESLKLDIPLGVDFTLGRNELSLSFDRLSERYFKPAMRRLANDVDRRILGLYKKVPNAVGTYNTAPTAITTFLSAKAKLDNLGIPDDERHFILDPTTETTIVGNLTTVFQAVPEVGRQYMKGGMGKAIDAVWHKSQNVNTHTVGALGGTPVVKGASQTGATLLVDGWTASVAKCLLEGDIITAADVNAVNPLTGQDTGELRQFTVTADQDSDASGEITIPIWPSIVTSGAYKTCTASPLNDAIVLIHGSASAYQNVVAKQPLYAHPEAFTYAIAPQEIPQGVHMAAMKSDPDWGLGISVVMDYDIDDNLFKVRFDILLGLLAQLPDFACRVYTS